MSKFTRITVLCFYLIIVFALPIFVIAQDATAPSDKSLNPGVQVDLIHELEQKTPEQRAKELEVIRELAVAQAAGSKEFATGWGERMGVGIGVGAAVIGGGIGIGLIGASAVNGLARQPEMADKIQTTMIIAAALIEGITLVALIVCILCVFM